MNKIFLFAKHAKTGENCKKYSDEFDNNITEIEQFTFCEAEALTSVDMPNVQTLRMNAFAGATSLTSVNMPNMQTVGESAFNTTSLISVDMPNVTTIEREAFYGTKALQYIGFDPTKLSTDNIGERAFSYWDPEAGSYKSFDAWDSCNKTTGICGSCGDKYLQTGLGCVSECGTGFTADSTVKQCVASQQVSESDCYANGQVYWDNACVDEYPFAKKHWTPAEAAEVLKDTDNEIIMTFKVNR
ncbi:MAG: leucine-rich repeat domain-containing protein [Alphaproteobacteria bacterium]|nr:leucine-rich repeat domain-containing protein [Alphaproteobacteria bacterium]